MLVQGVSFDGSNTAEVGYRNGAVRGESPWRDRRIWYVVVVVPRMLPGVLLSGSATWPCSIPRLYTKSSSTGFGSQLRIIMCANVFGRDKRLILFATG